MQGKRISTKRILLYFLLLLVIYVLETSAGLHMKIFGFRLDLLPAVVACVALCGGSTEGAVIGFLTGVLYDRIGVQIEGLYPAYFMLFAIFAGFLGAKYLKKTVSAAVILTIAAMGIQDAAKAVFSLAILKKTTGLLMVKNICGEILITAILAPLVFLLVAKMDEKLRAEDR